MYRRCIALLIVGMIAAVALVVPTWSSPSVTLVTAETRPSEISQQQYALLANPETFPEERLGAVRPLLVDDGKISPLEFASLGFPAVEATSSKRELLKRLEPELITGVFLHPDEPREVMAFSADICSLHPPREETELVTVGETTYQLRGFHFCGCERISGFSVYRNGVEVNSVRHFGHASAEVLLNNGNSCQFREDLSSDEASRLLEAFYDGNIPDHVFISSIIKPS
ncbi:MAG: hypothetical protein CMJ64_22355 [Planctomycetaceae bacterium]|nr:hypothetical protein [Planctomycetaceae bacterium]